MPYKYKNGWMGRVRIKGTCKTKLFQKKQEALAWESMMHTDPAKLRMSMGYSLLEWVNDYLAYAEKYSPKTLDEKKSVFKRLFKRFDAKMQITSVMPDNVLSHLTAQFKMRSGYGANKDRKNLSAAWEWGKKYKGFPKLNPFKVVDKFPEKRQPRYVPSEDDFWKVYETANKQDKVMLLTFLCTAGRRNEIFRLRWHEDINFVTETVRLYTRKRKDGTEEFEELPMTDELCNALMNHKQLAVTEWVFCDPQTNEPYLQRQHWLENLCRRAGVRHFGIHAIRHLTANVLLNQGVKIEVIKEILRHKSIATTHRYIGRLKELKPSLKLISKNKVASNWLVKPRGEKKKPISG